MPAYGPVERDTRGGRSREPRKGTFSTAGPFSLSPSAPSISQPDASRTIDRPRLPVRLFRGNRTAPESLGHRPGVSAEAGSVPLLTINRTLPTASEGLGTPKSGRFGWRSARANWLEKCAR